MHNNRLSYTARRMAALFGIAALVTTTLALADHSATGAGAAVFPAGTQLAGMDLGRLEFGHGVIAEADGSARGSLQVTLFTTLGVEAVVIEAEIASAEADGAGRVTLTGVAQLGGSLAVPGQSIPIRVVLGDSAVTLDLDSDVLPAADLVAGSFQWE